MADVLSVLRELRSLEQKKETGGSLSPAETARLAELQATLSTRFPPIAVPREESSPHAPFVDAVLQEEPTESRTGVMPREISAFDSEPASSPPSYGTPYKTPPPISPPAADVPGKRSPMSPAELQQWGQVFAPPASPTPFVQEQAAPAPAAAEPPDAWPIAQQAVLQNTPVTGVTGFADVEKTVMEHLPPIPEPAPAPASSPPSAPPNRVTASWAIPGPEPKLPLPGLVTPVPHAEAPAPSPATPIPQAEPLEIGIALSDDAPSVWADPATRVIPPLPEAAAPALPEPSAVPDLSSFPTMDGGDELTTVGGPVPAGLLPFAWPTPPVVPVASPPQAVPVSPPEIPIEPPFEDAITLDEADAPPETAISALPAPTFVPLDALELPSIDTDNTEDLTAVSAPPVMPAAVAPPPLPPPRPPAPPPMPAPRPPVAAPAPPMAPPPAPPWRAPAAPSAPAAAGASSFIGGESRVVIHTLEGVQKRGTLFDADLRAPALDLALPDGRSELVDTSKLKVVFFMVPIGQPVPRPQGEPVTVTLNDGRQLEGLSPDYRAGAPGFFICPLDQRSRAARIYVYAAAVKEIQ